MGLQVKHDIVQSFVQELQCISWVLHCRCFVPDGIKPVFYWNTGIYAVSLDCPTFIELNTLLYTCVNQMKIP